MQATQLDLESTSGGRVIGSIIVKSPWPFPRRQAKFRGTLDDISLHCSQAGSTSPPVARFYLGRYPTDRQPNMHPPASVSSATPHFSE
jgi:hypothetical protein